MECTSRQNSKQNNETKNSFIEIDNIDMESFIVKIQNDL